MSPILESANRVGTLIYDHAHANFFQQVLISTNLYQDAKNQAFSTFCSKDILDLKILQSDSPRAFWPISQESEFSQK